MTSVSEKNPKLISEWDDANELSPEQVSYAWRVTNAARSLANSVDDILGFSVPKEGPQK